MDLLIRYQGDDAGCMVWRVLIDGKAAGDFASLNSAVAMGTAEAGERCEQPDTGQFASLCL